MKIIPRRGQRALVIACSVFALSAGHSQAVTVISSGSYVGDPGEDRIASAPAGNPGLVLMNQDVLISGATFTGGKGGIGSGTRTSIGFNPGYGGNGGAALIVKGGNLTITGGTFTSGLGGFGEIPGVPGSVLQIQFGASVMISGGSFNIGGGASTLPAFDVSYGYLTLDGDFGALNGLTLTDATGTITGRLANNPDEETYSYSVEPGSSIHIIPEPSGAILAFAPVLTMLCRRRRRTGC